VWLNADRHRPAPAVEVITRLHRARWFWYLRAVGIERELSRYHRSLLISASAPRFDLAMMHDGSSYPHSIPAGDGEWLVR